MRQAGSRPAWNQIAVVTSMLLMLDSRVSRKLAGGGEQAGSRQHGEVAPPRGLCGGIEQVHA